MDSEYFRNFSASSTTIIIIILDTKILALRSNLAKLTERVGGRAQHEPGFTPDRLSF